MTEVTERFIETITKINQLASVSLGRIFTSADDMELRQILTAFRDAERLRAAKLVRDLMHDDQSPCSWHEAADCMEAIIKND